MKFYHTFAGAVLATSLIASTAFAGGLAEPVEIMPVEDIETAVAGSSSSAGLIVPLILIALIAAAVGGSDSSGEEVIQ